MTTLEDRLATLISNLGTDAKTYSLKTLTLTSAPAVVEKVRNLNFTLLTTVKNMSETYVNSALASYFNEWGAFRGINPYTTFADSLVRGYTPAGGPAYSGASGNFIEVQDRRITAGVGQNLWGRRWSDGRLVRRDILIKESYAWDYGDADPTAGGTITLPAGVKWTLYFTDTIANQPLPSWAPSGAYSVRPS